ncbi:MAG: hypothetical protein WBW36_09375, partial [Candidatus Sulfotelmatobacter sp.]
MNAFIYAGNDLRCAGVARAPSPASPNLTPILNVHPSQTSRKQFRHASRMSDTAEVLAKYRYRRRLPHLQKADADLFVTFCAGGPLILPFAARDLVFEHCLREGGLLPLAGEGARATPRIQLRAVVIMPDHVHLLLQPLRDTNG